MSVIAVRPPFAYFTDTAGLALDAGYVYIGVENLDPIANPITCYWDEALTIPAPIPIRTTGGYLSRNGSAAVLYTSGLFSILVKDKNGRLVYSAPTIDQDASLRADLASTASAGVGDALVGFKQFNSSGVLIGAASLTVHQKLQDFINIKDIGAKVDGTTDDYPALNMAMANFNNYSLPSNPTLGGTLAYNCGGRLYFPQGNTRIDTMLSLPVYTNIVGNPQHLSCAEAGFFGSQIRSQVSSGPTVHLQTSAIDGVNIFADDPGVAGSHVKEAIRIIGEFCQVTNMKVGTHYTAINFNNEVQYVDPVGAYIAHSYFFHQISSNIDGSDDGGASIIQTTSGLGTSAMGGLIMEYCWFGVGATSTNPVTSYNGSRAIKMDGVHAVGVKINSCNFSGFFPRPTAIVLDIYSTAGKLLNNDINLSINNHSVVTGTPSAGSVSLTYVSGNPITTGGQILASGVPTGVYITGQSSGTTGGTGVYTISSSTYSTAVTTITGTMTGLKVGGDACRVEGNSISGFNIGLHLPSTLTNSVVGPNYFSGNSTDILIDAGCSGNIIIVPNPATIITDNSGGANLIIRPASGGENLQGTWTPELLFGGANVGMTYATRGGTYNRVGNQCTIWARIVLSAKGSSTGITTISGLPFTVKNTQENYGAGGSCAQFNNMAALGNGILSVGVSLGVKTGAIFMGNAGVGLTNTSQANFTDTSEVAFSLSYLV